MLIQFHFLTTDSWEKTWEIHYPMPYLMTISKKKTDGMYADNNSLTSGTGHDQQDWHLPHKVHFEPGLPVSLTVISYPHKSKTKSTEAFSSAFYMWGTELLMSENCRGQLKRERGTKGKILLQKLNSSESYIETCKGRKCIPYGNFKLFLNW